MTDKKKQPAQTRVQLYLPHAEREMWEQAVVLSDYGSLSSMVRDLVKRFYKQVLKRAKKDCPE